MSNGAATQPAPTEYAPYYGKYITHVPDGDIVTTLGQQVDTTLELLRGLSEAQGDLRYAPDKWSIKEVVGHLIDTERIFAYRALRFARNDPSPLTGFDQNEYVRSAPFGECQLSALANELEHVRRSNVYLFKHLDSAAWLRSGVANENEVSVRALAYVMAGHERHHVEILKTRYL